MLRTDVGRQRFRGRFTRQHSGRYRFRLCTTDRQTDRGRHRQKEVKNLNLTLDLD